jgi:hypothetical protein
MNTVQLVINTVPVLIRDARRTNPHTIPEQAITILPLQPEPCTVSGPYGKDRNVLEPTLKQNYFSCSVARRPLSELGQRQILSHSANPLTRKYQGQPCISNR